MRVSVLIPTYNRLPTLRRTLGYLFAQQGAPEMEIIVADDGSTDGTASALHALQGDAPLMLRVLAQANRGPAVARNRMLQQAQGELVLFLGDDIFAEPDLVATHLRCHDQNPQPSVAVLGQTAFSPEMPTTSLRHYIERSGLQFAYQLIQDPANAPYSCFYTSNLSLKRDYLLENGLFDEDFPCAAYEDIELGYRLQKEHGLRIVYEPQARAHHYHPVGIQQLKGRGRIKGRSAVILGRKQPGALDVEAVLRLFPWWKVALKRVFLALSTPVAEYVERTGWVLPLDKVYAWTDAYYSYLGMLEELAEEKRRCPATNRYGGS